MKELWDWFKSKPGRERKKIKFDIFLLFLWLIALMVVEIWIVNHNKRLFDLAASITGLSWMLVTATYIWLRGGVGLDVVYVFAALKDNSAGKNTIQKVADEAEAVSVAVVRAIVIYLMTMVYVVTVAQLVPLWKFWPALPAGLVFVIGWLLAAGLGGTPIKWQIVAKFYGWSIPAMIALTFIMGGYDKAKEKGTKIPLSNINIDPSGINFDSPWPYFIAGIVILVAAQIIKHQRLRNFLNIVGIVALAIWLSVAGGFKPSYYYNSGTPRVHHELPQKEQSAAETENEKVTVSAEKAAPPEKVAVPTPSETTTVPAPVVQFSQIDLPIERPIKPLEQLKITRRNMTLAPPIIVAYKEGVLPQKMWKWTLPENQNEPKYLVQNNYGRNIIKICLLVPAGQTAADFETRIEAIPPDTAEPSK